MLNAGKHRLTLSVADTRRTFWLHVPPVAAAPVPAVVLLHGAGGTGLWADLETGWSDLADAAGFWLALPEGTPVHPAKPPKFLTNPQIWNDGSGQWGEAQDRCEDVAFLALLLDELVRLGPVHPRRRFVTGFSNGAGMTFRLAAACADRVAAIAPVAGHWWLDTPRPLRPVPTLYLTGTEDPLIPLHGGPVHNPWHITHTKPPVARTLRRWAEANGWRGDEPEVTREPGLRLERYPTDRAEVRAVIIEGLGHHWPGGRGQLDERIGGKPSDRVQATRMIWDFFSRLG